MIYHNKSFQTGKRPKGYCCRKNGKDNFVSKMSALSGKCRICRQLKSSCKTKSSSHSAEYQRRNMGAAILSIWLLQRALHSVQ